MCVCGWVGGWGGGEGGGGREGREGFRGKSVEKEVSGERKRGDKVWKKTEGERNERRRKKIESIQALQRPTRVRNLLSQLLRAAMTHICCLPCFGVASKRCAATGARGFRCFNDEASRAACGRTNGVGVSFFFSFSLLLPVDLSGLSGVGERRQQVPMLWKELAVRRSEGSEERENDVFFISFFELWLVFAESANLPCSTQSLPKKKNSKADQYRKHRNFALPFGRLDKSTSQSAPSREG